MTTIRILAGAAALASILALTAHQAQAASTDYRFELVGKPRLVAKKDIVQVRLVRAADGKPVPDAVIFESKADMGPAGMETMTAPGVWALHLAAKVQGEPDTVRGTVNADLVK